MQSSMYDYISPVFGNHENSSSHSFSTTESSVHNLLSPCGSLTEHIQTITNYINEADEKDLYNFFVDLVYQIFGHGPMTGWSLDKLKMKKLNDQFSYGESDSVYQFLCCNGYIFKLCYKLLPNSSIKFNIFFNDIPIGLRQKIENSIGHSYYGSRFLYPIDSNKPIGLGLNTFEYYMFHFALYGLKLTENDVSYLDDIKQESSVYKLLCLNYLQYFLPLENSASKILPKLPFNVLSTNTNQKQFTSPSSSLCFLKKELYCTDKSDKVECSWIVKSEATWRSELVAFFLVDIWLNYNIISLVPSIKLNVLIRCLIKHFHLYSNRAKQQPIDDLKSILIVRHGVSIYRYLSYYMINWPQDFSFRILLEIWLCYIQPWRYDGFNNQTFSITESEMSNKWRVFIMKNLLCYTKLFYLAIKRFNCVDICTPKYSIMIFRFLKIFTHPYLLRILLDIENLLTQKQYTEVDAIVADYLAEAEGPLYKYEPMFSENRISEYTLFVTKLHNTLDHINFKLNQFQKENMDSSSMVEKIFSLRNQKMSEYSVTQWEDLRTNIQSSLFYIKHIFNVNAVPLSMDLDSQSVSSFDSSHNVSGIIRKNNLLIQSFKRSSSYLFSKASHNKQWEIDPDYLGTLTYENDILVKLSIFLRDSVDLYWKSQILKYSSEDTFLAGVLRQILIRPPLLIFSYEPRNDGSGKRIRTPKIVQPTISFRWIASYYNLTWILFLLTVFIVSKYEIGLCIIFFYVFRFTYMCLKYWLGYAPPFTWDNLHEN